MAETFTKRRRYTGRDFDLYFLTEEDKVSEVLNKGDFSFEHQSRLFKMVASLGCSFDSTATFETIVDKSTPKNGFKQLQKVEWSFSSENNIANIHVVKNLLNAHKTGSELYVLMASQVTGSRDGIYTGNTRSTDFLDVDTSIDAEGTKISVELDQEGKITEIVPFIEGACLITSIRINARDGELANFSFSMEGSGDFEANVLENIGIGDETDDPYWA